MQEPLKRGEAIGGSGPMFCDSLDTRSADQPPKNQRDQDHVVRVPDYRDEVGNEVDWGRQIGNEQPHGQPDKAWDGAVAGKSPDQTEGIGNQPNGVPPGHICALGGCKPDDQRQPTDDQDGNG